MTINNNNPYTEPEFSDGIRNWGTPHIKLKDNWIYTILTKRIQKRWERREGPKSLKKMGVHFLCETDEELEKQKKQYPMGGEYEGSEIINIDITHEGEGWGAS